MVVGRDGLNKKPFDPTDPAYVSRIEKRLKYTVLVDAFTEPEEKDVVILGSCSRTWRNKKYREVKRNRADIVEGRVDSPIAHARDYLLYCYSRRPAKYDQRITLKKKSMPLHVYPCVLEDAAYVDISSAWWSIMNVSGWDTEYWPGEWFGPGSPPDDFPLPSNKVARSSLVTIARSNTIPVWREGKIHQERVYNRTENLHIWGLVADVLQTVARTAVTVFGARYCNTDGYILPRSNAALLQEYIEGLNLHSRVKWTGPCIVVGAGCYFNPTHSTVRQCQFGETSNLDFSTNAEWLIQRFCACNFYHKVVQ